MELNAECLGFSRLVCGRGRGGGEDCTAFHAQNQDRIGSPCASSLRRGESMTNGLVIQVATLDYIRMKTNVPVPEVYHYESNPYNEVEAEYIIMSKVSF
jgi:hypothetical protein